MRKTSREPFDLTMEAYAFFPGRRKATIKITEYLENLAGVGDMEENETAKSVLDRLYFEGNNDPRGVFTIGDDDVVRVYVTARNGFKRVV
jgi:hypothetical protein